MSESDPAQDSQEEPLVSDDITRTIPFGALPAPAHSEDLPPPGPMATEVVGGPMDGLRIVVDGNSLSIGRSISNDLALVLDPAASNRHARIERVGGHHWLEDLGSSNGTWLGDKRIEERVLVTQGTTFLIGQTRLEFMPG